MIRNIALVAHDARKAELVNWVKFNAGSLQSCRLYCTGTTGRLIEEALREELGDRCPEITKLLSGPLGGDAQISAMIAEYAGFLLRQSYHAGTPERCDGARETGLALQRSVRHQQEYGRLHHIVTSFPRPFIRKGHPCLHRKL